MSAKLFVPCAGAFHASGGDWSIANLFAELDRAGSDPPALRSFRSTWGLE